FYFCFFFQAEDGIRDRTVTGVQTCALPISLEDLGLEAHGIARPAARDRLAEMEPGDQRARKPVPVARARRLRGGEHRQDHGSEEIGRASCRERGERGGGEG